MLQISRTPRLVGNCFASLERQGVESPAKSFRGLKKDPTRTTLWEFVASPSLNEAPTVPATALGRPPAFSLENRPLQDPSLVMGTSCRPVSTETPPDSTLPLSLISASPNLIRKSTRDGSSSSAGSEISVISIPPEHPTHPEILLLQKFAVKLNLELNMPTSGASSPCSPGGFGETYSPETTAL